MDIAPLLHISPHKLMIQAREHPEKVPFPVFQIGHVVRFPTKAVLRYLEEDLGMGEFPFEEWEKNYKEENNAK